MLEVHELIIPIILWFAVYLIHYRFGNICTPEKVLSVEKNKKSMPRMYSISIGIAIFLSLCLAYIKFVHLYYGTITGVDLQMIGLGFVSMIFLHLALLRDES